MIKKELEIDQLPCFEITVDDNSNSGIKMVSLVEDPAIEMKGMFFSNDKMSLKKFNFEKVSFDFDDTLSRKKYQDLAKELIAKGEDVHIVTRRRKDQSAEVYKIAEELGISRDKVHFTEGKLKYETIKRLGIKKHYDNNENEIEKINEMTDAEGIIALEDIKCYEFKAIKEQMKIVGPAMVPHKKIYRKDGDYEYFVTFSPKTIKKLVEKFNKENNNRSINVDHSAKMVNAYIEQNWIVDDPIYDKSKMYGYNLQPGTWFIEVKIEDKKFWEEEVKELGKYSFSVEGFLSMKPQYMSSQIIDEMSDAEILDLAFELLKGPVSSSNVAEYRYNTRKKVLVLKFNDGTRYKYTNVNRDTFDAIVNGEAICETEGSNEYGSWFVGKTPSVGAAVWQYLIDTGVKYEKMFAETYNDYPKQASENAKIALRWAEENGWGSCGTPVGKARANQLANREPISRETIARMAAFERHRQNSQKELGDGCGRLMWLAWGGDAGIEWAQRKLEQIDKKEKLQNQQFVNPGAKETESEFISRCMGDDTMLSEYPDQSQRAAVCYAYWDKK